MISKWLLIFAFLFTFSSRSHSVTRHQTQPQRIADSVIQRAVGEGQGSHSSVSSQGSVPCQAGRCGQGGGSEGGPALPSQSSGSSHMTSTCGEIGTCEVLTHGCLQGPTVNPCSGSNGAPPKCTSPEPVKVTLFGKGVFADVIR